MGELENFIIMIEKRIVELQNNPTSENIAKVSELHLVNIKLKSIHLTIKQTV